MNNKIKLDLEPLTPELIKKAEEELRETPERVNESLEELRKLLNENTSIYFKNSPEVLTRFLRPVKFYPESALALVSTSGGNHLSLRRGSTGLSTSLTLSYYSFSR